MNIDISFGGVRMAFNYLKDAIKGIDFKKSSDYKICNQTGAMICGKSYQDPDSVSKKLYEDISFVFSFNHRKLSHVSRKGSLYLRFDDEIIHELSTDYIGPSRAWALEYLEGDINSKSNIVGDFLLVSRTIGGHVFWPAHQKNRFKTINQVKGGRGIYDRFDVTLAELKNYYETQINCEKKIYNWKFHKPLYDAFVRYRWFFKEYKSFPNYIEKMKLEMFLNEGEVFSLTKSKVKSGSFVSIDNSYEPLNYLQYIANCKTLIAKRTSILEQMLK